jgi:hypothetical protein
MNEAGLRRFEVDGDEYDDDDGCRLAERLVGDGGGEE